MPADDLTRTLALANPFKEGDLAVGGTKDDRIRAEARGALRSTTVGEIRRTAFVDDGVSAALERSRDRALDSALDPLTIGRLQQTLLGAGGPEWARRHQRALPSEVIAAITKVSSDDELSAIARSIFNPVPGDGIAIGGPRHFGSRIQPNSPGDDDLEILFSTLEGLSYGCGDVIIGVNPASDEVSSIVRLEELLERTVRRLQLPTRFCVLSDIVKQDAARARTRVDVAFQSLAGTSGAIAGMIGLDVDGLADLTGAFDALYFETGQGSEVTNGAAEGLDMVTLEARTYGVARLLAGSKRRSDPPQPWMIVNDVAGFIGPEVFTTEAQLERACLEDIVMAKLHGLTMGLDVCATFHMGIPPASLRQLTARLAERAAPAYLMAVAGDADPMLGYMTTPFRQHPELRTATRRGIASPMARRLAALGVDDAGPRGPSLTARLYAAYAKAGGDRRTQSALEDEGLSHLHTLRARGFDLGGGSAADADARVERIYTNARAALYASIEDAVIRDACPRSVRVRTVAADRDAYLAHPATGEQIRDDDARALTALYAGSPPQVVLVVSDGLNANAINEQLRRLLPAVRRHLSSSGGRLGGVDVVIRNGRVRAAYEIGGLVGAEVVIHVIGERPGTGLNTLSAYLTYGRDASGQPRWARGLDHSATTAVCGIHPQGRPPDAAAEEIARTVTRILEQRRSGVALVG